MSLLPWLKEEEALEFSGEGIIITELHTTDELIVVRLLMDDPIGEQSGLYQITKRNTPEVFCELALHITDMMDVLIKNGFDEIPTNVN